MPQAGHSIAHLFCEKEGGYMKKSGTYPSAEVMEVCGGMTNATLTGEENAKSESRADSP